MEQKQKSDLAKIHPRMKFKTHLRIKTEHIESTIDDDIVEIFAGKTDGHFTYPKSNENPAESHNFSCKICKAVFRDNHKLRNHASNHTMEFYECLQCHKYLRLMRSFENHQASHKASHQCQQCGKAFALKTSLYNHSQVHSNNRMHCSYPGCQRTFKHWQNQLEHITRGHHDTKDIPCTICKKMFQMPTSMRAHQIHQHGPAPDLIQGHPLSGCIPSAAKKKKFTRKRRFKLTFPFLVPVKRFVFIVM